MTVEALYKMLAGLFLLSLVMVLLHGWARRGWRSLKYRRIDVLYKDPANAGRPSAKVHDGFWIIYENVETFVCHKVNAFSGATWISKETGREVGLFDPLYNQLNDAARKAQLEWENK